VVAVTDPDGIAALLGPDPCWGPTDPARVTLLNSRLSVPAEISIAITVVSVVASPGPQSQ
jgi:hypothetical protein